ncbi:histidinol-phosphatase HisJ [Heyndrickxia acidicola]|uniref:Histidinol-phosphatase n=1 Tax=Heyndrickxia acidicola TaxID=209389 RepID=A0ABU6MEY7_9BACI|nr:histidinol-phosphatase HisJ [Heyndrickxia acidicola]MED1201600.1 histidinol-phosphatase HisJ [Heyndrickxia acidicola]
MLVNGDFHVHTQYCPHGSKDAMELYVQAALKKELNCLSFTEHAPLPSGFRDPVPNNDSTMQWEDVPAYLAEANLLRKKYKKEIEVNTGYEVDYVLGYENETIKLLKLLKANPVYSILSVHMLRAPGGEYVCIDYSPEEFSRIIQLFGSVEKVYEEYFQTLKRAIQMDLGPYKPKRIGHITLIDKFSALFKSNYDYSSDINEILSLIKENNYSLDANTAGFFKEYCGICYPPPSILEKAASLDIPLIPGSDSHAANDIAKGFGLLPANLTYSKPL